MYIHGWQRPIQTRPLKSFQGCKVTTSPRSTLAHLFVDPELFFFGKIHKWELVAKICAAVHIAVCVAVFQCWLFPGQFFCGPNTIFFSICAQMKKNNWHVLLIWVKYVLQCVLLCVLQSVLQFFLAVLVGMWHLSARPADTRMGWLLLEGSIN